MDHTALIDLRRRRPHRASRFATVAGCDVHWIDEGVERDLPATLLLSAQWLGADHFHGFAGELAVRTRIVRLDLPGHGLSGGFPDGDHSAAGYARLIRAFAAHIGLGPHVLVGQSHSGIPAALLAADPGSGVRGLVLATSSGMPRDRKAAPTGAAADSPHPAGSAEWYEDRLRPLLLRASPAALAAAARDYGELPGRAADSAQRLRLFDPELLSRTLPQVAVPARVLWSEASTYLPPAMADAVAALLPDCRGCTVIPGTGHLLLADAPHEAADTVLNFLETLA